MTNNEIRGSIKEIIRIKALKCREQELREKIFKELRKRRKDKLGLGGEDFVKITEVETKEYSPFVLFCKLYKFDAEEVESPNTKARLSSVEDFCEMVSILKGAVKERYGEKFFDRIIPVGSRSHNQLSYSISLDEKNRVRGIDL